MVQTALDIITESLVDLGVLSDEETPTASMAAGGLVKLNDMIDAWNIEELMVYGSTPNVFNLTANKGIYTLGPGGDFNIPRPNFVTGAYLRDPNQSPNSVDFYVHIYTEEEYADYSVKGLTISMPQGIYIDNQYPLSNVYFIGIPSTTQYKMVLWTQGVITNFELNDPVNLAPGYKRAIKSNLVIELAPGYAREPKPATVAIANQSKADLKTMNFSLNELSIDPRLAGPRGYNQYTGQNE